MVKVSRKGPRSRAKAESSERLRSWAEQVLKDSPDCLQCEDVEECLGEEEAEELRLASSVLRNEF